MTETPRIGVLHDNDSVIITDERVQILDDCGMGERGQDRYLHRKRTEFTLPFQCVSPTLGVAVKGVYEIV